MPAAHRPAQLCRTPARALLPGIQALQNNPTDKLTFLYQKQSKPNTEVYKQQIFFLKTIAIFPLKKQSHLKTVVILAS